MEAKKAITLKLLIDTKANRVLFAEASKDFVDFLFFLLSLPIGTVIKLLSGKSMAGSIGNLYNSFANLNEIYLEPNLNKSVLLNPEPSVSVIKSPLLIGTSTSTSSDYVDSSKTMKKVYLCSNCRRTATNKLLGANCIACSLKGTMVVEINYVASTSDASLSASYVQGVISYMISDDLSVTPMSMISSISMMSKFKITNLSVLQEKDVEIGSEEGLELLKASFESLTVLSDVFLGKKEENTASSVEVD